MNRKEAVNLSLKANLENAEYHISEIIHVDNNSEHGFADWFKAEFHPSIQVRHRENLGVSRGYNTGMALAKGSHIVITGCDRLMPKAWLKTFVNAFEKIRNTGVISIYTTHKHDDIRLRADKVTRNGITIQHAIPFEARMHSKEFLFKVGFFREDFGLYGFEDCEWADRAERVANQYNLINYIIPDMGLATHLSEGNDGSYLEFKIREADDERKRELVETCKLVGSPYYNPYFRIEGTFR